MANERAQPDRGSGRILKLFKPAADACRICAGPLELARRGGDAQYSSSAFRPTSHPPHGYGDLYRCCNCETMQQPSVPRGKALHDLYRGVKDPDYLCEELGRRRTAQRVLDLLGRFVPHDRLLDVGCGYGLLLDEARRRGYVAEGLDLWKEGVDYASETLGLTVRNMAFEEADLEGESYDAVLMVDVLEHFEDPARAIARARDLLTPGGVLLTVTPDPSSPIARLAGERWWAYLPSHVCLIPRATLRELMHAHGLETVQDVLSRHSFTPGYWLKGLAESSSLARGASALLAARLPSTVLLTASLREERVMLAQRTTADAPARSPGEAARATWAR